MKLTMKDLKDQIEWMEEHGYDLSETEVRAWNTEDQEFMPVSAFVEDNFNPEGPGLEIHVENPDN